RHTVGGTEAELDASSLAPGMYLLQLRSEGRQAVKTLVKE
ncbi:MAG: T9SS type A sorting domain-containing protein, partial [Flavobacteriaceae bacterium]